MWQTSALENGTKHVSVTANQNLSQEMLSNEILACKMTYVPPPHMRPAIPDFNDLPTTIGLPHSRSLPIFVLVIASICLMTSAFSGVWMPIVWNGISVGTQGTITFFLTIASLGSGILALRRYASEDEVTIDTQGVRQRKLTWFGTERISHGWGEFQSITQSGSASGHQILELVLSDENETTIAVFVAKDQSRMKFIKQQIEKLLSSA